MLNPDEIPFPWAVPIIVLSWGTWFAMLASERRARRAVSRFYEAPKLEVGSRDA